MKDFKRLVIDIDKKIFEIDGEDVSKAKSLKVQVESGTVTIQLEQEYIGVVVPF